MRSENLSGNPSKTSLLFFTTMTSMRGGSRSYQTEGRSRRAGYPLHSVGAVTERTSSPQPLGTAQETLPDWRSGFTAIENPSRWREDRDTLHHVHLIKRLRGFSPRGRFTCTLPRPLHWIIMTTACFGTVCLSNAEASSEGSLGITTWIDRAPQFRRSGEGSQARVFVLESSPV